MSSRFPTSFHMSYCYHPVRISKNGITYYVPCCKCNGCLLHRANSLSFRVGDEIESTPHSIFFTLTYSNKYVPKIQCRVQDGLFHWYSAANNIRFNGVRDVLRDPVCFSSKYHLFAPLKNYDDDHVIGYCSKSDIQLWLKLLRKDIYENFNISSGAFRYYIIAEYGPGKSPLQGKFRPHYHGIIFPKNKEIATYLIRFGLYKNWQMCDKGLFEQYTKFCDSGTRHYVTEYITGTSSLPELLSHTKEIKPFVLMSKQNGALGTCSFDRKEVSKAVEQGIDSYYKSVSRIERNYLFQYPKALTDSLFPKCSRYSLLSFAGLLRIYGYLYNVRQVGYELASLFDGLSELSSQDVQASRCCLKVCDLMSWTPYYYTEVLVDFYYRKAMSALRFQYEFQEAHINDPFICIAWFNNWQSWLTEPCNTSYWFTRHYDTRCWFLQSFGLDVNMPDWYFDNIKAVSDNYHYVLECDDIISSADKSKKVNSLVGLAPHIV